MSHNKPRLELTWIGKDQRPKLEPRILVEDPELSYRASKRVGEHDIYDNMLIQGDNLLALKALEQEYAGKVRCVIIDPPYNIGAAFEHYDDGIEHSLWLGLMRGRLEILWRMLTDDGSLWITIDDHESHYLKVMCDELFGRHCYMTSIVWEKDKGRRSDTAISASHDYVLIYVRNREIWSSRRNLLARSEEQERRYRNPDNDPRGPWLQGDNGTAKSASDGSRWHIRLPSGREVQPPPGRGWSFSKQTFEDARTEGRVYFGADGNGMPIIKRYLTDVQDGVVPRTWWPADEAGHNQEAKRDHLNKLLAGIPPFATPKPERLIHRVLHIATNPGDLVLDSFLGSGTSAAVAHKMGRRWIGIELGDHCVTHCHPRLKKVIDGHDPGGITESVGWKGGGGFRFYRLAPSLLERDKWGNWIISPQYNAPMLAEAMCKLQNFRYAPDPEIFWIHGRSTESDYLYVTDQHLTHDQLQALSDEVGPNRTLMICCRAYRAREDAFPNLTLKKIPQAVLDKCEWGKDDYSLNVQEQPAMQSLPEVTPDGAPAPRKKKPKAVSELPLFSGLKKGEKG